MKASNTATSRYPLETMDDRADKQKESQAAAIAARRRERGIKPVVASKQATAAFIARSLNVAGE